MEWIGLWIAVWVVIFFVWGIWSLAARLSRWRPRPRIQASHSLAIPSVDHKMIADAQKRREDTRAGCELLYNLHAHEIGDRFNRETFNDWLTRYMGDGQEPQYVEKRGQQLQGIIRDLVKQVRPPEQPHTVAELNMWRSKLREQIIEGEQNPEAQEDQIMELDKRYEELQKRIIRGDLP